MSNYPEHVCRHNGPGPYDGRANGAPMVDEMGDPLAPEACRCGSCGRSWCERCHPAPAALCPFDNGDAAGVAHDGAAIPPRQARRLFAGATR